MFYRPTARLSVVALIVLLLALAPQAVALSSSNGPASPRAPTRVFLPLIAAAPGPAQSAIPFWSGRYTLPVGGCATLHWRIEGAKAVFLDGMPEAGVGTRDVCPTEIQFYTLEVIRESAADLYEVVLSARAPALAKEEVIAQGAVAKTEEMRDIDPTTPGDQAGHRVALTAAQPLFAGTPGWDHPNAVVLVPQTALDLGENGPVHWPLRVGQGVEFRAACDGAACRLDYTTEHYLYVTTE